MANWAYVKNNQIVETHYQLPRNWKNVSGLNMLQNDLVTLETLGWYPVIKQHQEFDSAAYQINGYLHTFNNKQVIETLDIIELSIDPNYIQQQKNNFLIDLRNQRNKLLQESDWTQLVDTNNLLSDSEKQMWVTYRQQLRDLPEQYLTNDVISLSDVVWPVPDTSTDQPLI